MRIKGMRSRLTVMACSLLILVIALWTLIPETPEHAMARSGGAPADTAPEKFVLQVGINNYLYGDIPKLDGAVQDVDDLKEVLMKKFDVPANHFVTLKNEQA